MNAEGVPAWDYLINGEEDPDWIGMNGEFSYVKVLKAVGKDWGVKVA